MAQCVYALSALAPQHAKRPYTNASTSGAAAWISTEGAITRAVSELIERDAFARCWLKREAPPRIAPAQIPDAIQRRLDALSAAGYAPTVQLLESSYLPVVSVFMQSRLRRYTALSTAAAFQFEDALDAALGEAESRVQEYHGRPPETGMAPGEVHVAHDHGNFYRTAKNFRAADFYAGARRELSGRELKARLRKLPKNAAALMGRLQADGVPIYACDITAPGSSILQGRTPLQVWRAFVPGLLPLWFGHGCEPYGLLERHTVSLGMTPAQLRRLVSGPSPIHPCT
jgi:ribosomal protein S12 methylthiotransferase accessory factor